eukprot:1657736-Lingulodinium_polyedra.AAC.1
MLQVTKRAAVVPQASACRDYGVVVAPQEFASIPAKNQEFDDKVTLGLEHNVLLHRFMAVLLAAAPTA